MIEIEIPIFDSDMIESVKIKYSEISHESGNSIIVNWRDNSVFILKENIISHDREKCEIEMEKKCSEAMVIFEK